ncbi:MAG: hypothetical protein AAF492_17795, partial [Verrucomicrobiota bacterium]
TTKNTDALRIPDTVEYMYNHVRTMEGAFPFDDDVVSGAATVAPMIQRMAITMIDYRETLSNCVAGYNLGIAEKYSPGEWDIATILKYNDPLNVDYASLIQSS